MLTQILDIARIAAMGVKAYSFSLSWSRIFPFGRGAVNELAIAHYNDIINTCIEYDVIPQVTLYHWDTPLVLQDMYGGWLSEKIVHDFVEYARVAYGRFGGRVKYWYTVNERELKSLDKVREGVTDLAQPLCSAISIRCLRAILSNSIFR